jgi:hypothetical protein
MKRIALMVLAVVLFAGQSWAAGWSTTSFLSVKNKIVMELTWVAAANGSVETFDISNTDLKEYYLMLVVTDPGATAPTANYDIVINDSYGDVLGGALANRSASATERFESLIPYSEDWTIVITNNSVDSATGKIILTFAK